MNCTEQGVGFNSKEIRTLLKFASREDADRDKYGVKIVVKGDRVWARATDGHNSLELDGESDEQLDTGEWFVHREYLEQAVKLVVGVKAVLRLSFSGASLNHAIVEDNGVETGSFDVPHDAAVADTTFPWAKDLVSVPSRRRTIAHCSALPGTYASLLEEVEAAVGVEYSDLYPPEDPEHPWVFVVNDSGQTQARGTLRSAKSVASTKGTGDEDGSEDGGEDAPRRSRRKKNERQQEIAS
jgi:hypothetical protein